MGLYCNASWYHCRFADSRISGGHKFGVRGAALVAGNFERGGQVKFLVISVIGPARRWSFSFY